MSNNNDIPAAAPQQTNVNPDAFKIEEGSKAGEQTENHGYSIEKKRKVRIILGIVAVLFIAALIAGGVVLVVSSQNSDNDNNSGDGNNDGKKTTIYLEDVLSGKFTASAFNGSWSGSGSTVLYKENNSIVEYDVKSKTKRALLYDEFRQYPIYEKSADGQLLLLAKNYKKNFRHSFEAEYDIYNISSGQIQPLNIKGSREFVSLVRWAPVGNGLIINFERNLYYKPTAFADEITLTSDEHLGIVNGITDWVYEEEVFSSNAATWFNPNGTQIAFIKFDDTSTHLINLQFYGDAGDINFQYPLNRYITYPKAGSPNPRVTLHIANLVRAAEGLEFLTEIPVPSALNTETDYIITMVEWLDNDNVLSAWMNRVQNRAYMQVFDGGVKRREIYSMESKTGWIDLFYVPLKNRDGSRIALKLSQPQGTDGSEYRHLCIISTRTANSNVEVLTSGKYVVQELLHWDGANDVIFYMANTFDNPEVTHLYAIKAQKGEKEKCLTCNLHKSGDVVQTYYTADFDTTDNFVMIASRGPGIPMSDIYEWTYASNQITLKKLMNWEHNENLRTKLKDIHLPTTEIHTIPISDGFTAQVLLQLPPNIDRSGKRKYAMLVDVYGGPDSSAVTSRWGGVDWDTYLSSNHSVIIAKIDGRGSNLRGDKLLHSIYHKLGTIEIYDQIHVTKQLVEKFPFIDEHHVGIWGWSYGGYAAAMALGTNTTLNIFKCGASVAPVTDWAYYDSIYTERYMGLPKDDEKAYNDSRLSTRGSSLIGKDYLLIHGTLDDNVHYQQAMMLAKNLERRNILFKQISYPDEDHALVSVRPHLYHSLDKFFGECFDNKRMMRWGQ